VYYHSYREKYYKIQRIYKKITDVISSFALISFIHLYVTNMYHEYERTNFTPACSTVAMHLQHELCSTWTKHAFCLEMTHSVWPIRDRRDDTILIGQKNQRSRYVWQILWKKLLFNNFFSFLEIYSFNLIPMLFNGIVYSFDFLIYVLRSFFFLLRLLWFYQKISCILILLFLYFII